MNQESQNIEYKESWRDEYLKWICGFANAHASVMCDWTAEKLMESHKSIKYNPLIANTLFKAGFIEI